MTVERLTRRGFVADAGRVATSGWLALQIPWLASLAGCEAEEVRPGARGALSAAEASTLRAFAARILPDDDGTPGAAQLGTEQFVEHALTTPFFVASSPLVRTGLADLDARAHADFGRRSFAALEPSQQLVVMRQIEHTPFFAAARSLVVIGAFADPSYGGNAHAAGWTMVGIDHQPAYTAPFGWYDAHPSGAAEVGA